MYIRKVLLVDDEQPILDGLKVLIDWEELGYEIIGTSKDGMGAKKIALEHQPDLIITDIRMPGMDGLALIKSLYKQLPDTKFLIVSGYSDFTYAKEAINYGASGYLLKPIEEEELIQLLVNIGKELDERDQQQKMMGELSLLNIINQPKLFKEEVCAYLSHAQITLPLQSFCVVTLEIEDNDYDEERRSQYKLIKDILDDETKDITQYKMVQNKHNTYTLLFFTNGVHETRYLIIRSILEQVQQEIKALLDVESLVCMSSIKHDVSEIFKAYKECKRVSNYRLVRQKLTMITYEEYLNKEEQALTISESFLKDIVIYVEINDKKKLKKQIYEFIMQFSDKPSINPDIVFTYCIDIVIIVKKIIYQLGIDFNSVVGFDIMDIQGLMQNKTIDQLGDWLFEILSKAADEIAVKLNEKTRIEEIKEYINENYGQVITLQTLGKKFHMSSFYISQFFKKESGGNFIDYLKKVRMQNAIKLLATTDYKIYEISELVGYNNPRCFSDIFKKNFGMNPSEYRNSIKELPPKKV